MFVLIVNSGGTSRRYELADGDTIIGRGADCHLVINDESVSRRHARLTVQGNRVELSDLDSANGIHFLQDQNNTVSVGRTPFGELLETYFGSPALARLQ